MASIDRPWCRLGLEDLHKRHSDDDMDMILGRIESENDKEIWLRLQSIKSKKLEACVWWRCLVVDAVEDMGCRRETVAGEGTTRLIRGPEKGDTGCAAGGAKTSGRREKSARRGRRCRRMRLWIQFLMLIFWIVVVLGFAHLHVLVIIWIV